MANVLEATIDAVTSTSGDVAGAARHGVEALGEQVSTLASKLGELIEPEPKHASRTWLWGLLILALAGAALIWWRRSTADQGDETRTDARGAARPVSGTRAVS